MTLLQRTTLTLLIASGSCLSNTPFINNQPIALDSMNAELLFNLGQGLHALKKYPEALEAYKKSLSLKPNNPEARLLLAQIYKNQTNYDEAIKILIEGLALEPHHITLTVELGQTYASINKLDKSLALYQELNEHIPNNPSIIFNIACTLTLMNKLDESLLFYTKALESEQYYDAAMFNRGRIYLTMGNFEKGWEEYEWRHRFRTYDQPLWDGSDLNGKTILLHAEQGLGDTFQFIRYAKLAKEKNGIVIAAVQAALIPIIKLCEYIDDVVSQDEIPYYDVHAPLMSLPYILHTRLDSIPHECPYLNADEQLVTHWKEQLATNTNFKIGICWQGKDNPKKSLFERAIIRKKSITLQQFSPLSAIPGISLYSLQKINGTDQLNDLQNMQNFITFDGDFDQSNGSFMDTAAVIKNLDLVITVDTSIAHLAAGLGVNTWVILASPADWRWMIDRTDTPWYPTMRLFRQPTPDDWETVIQEVAEELKQYSAQK